MELAARRQVPKAELRNFGLLLGALFVVFFAAVPWLRHRSIEYWPWVVTATLWLGALAWPRILAWPHRWWTLLGEALGWFNTRVILTVIYFVAVTPLGFVMWVFGRDRMKRGFDPKCESYRVSSRSHPPRSMEKPF
jgi:hypothetical protein